MYPIPPYPEYRPAQPKRSSWQRFRSLGCGKQSLIGCLSLLVLFGAFLCVLGTPAFVRGWNGASATNTAMVHVTATQSSQASNHPRMGGNLSDFVATYGLPTATAPDSETFAADNKRVQVRAYVTTGTTTVDRIFLSGPPAWNVNDDKAFCDTFLPGDAVEFKRNVGVINWLDFHSSLGEIVEQLQTPTCLLFVSPS